MNVIFVFGSERSGTTFLGSLLGSHSEAVTVPEAHFVSQVYRGVAAQDGTADLGRALEEISRNFRFKLWGIRPSLRDLEPYGLGSYAGLIEALVAEYAKAAGQPNASVWIDHTPGNVRSAAFLAELFPDAKFIHLVRDGRAVVASVRGLDWGLRSARTIIGHWALQVGYGLAAESYLTPERCLRVRYEDLVTDPTAVLGRLCAFAGLAFEPAMLSGSGFAVPAYTQKQHALVGAPPNARRINAWTEALSPRDVETCEYVTGDLLTYLGYTPVFGHRARLEPREERYRAQLADLLWYRWADRVRRKRRRKQGLQNV